VRSTAELPWSATRCKLRPPIHIIVANGHVTLVGVVAAQADKDIAGVRANTLSGGFSADNKLRVEGK
jgi:hyperosmotically inducible protein